jgi:hypothetical protein
MAIPDKEVVMMDVKERMRDVLLRDAALHETGQLGAIGADFDELDTLTRSAQEDVMIAWGFWEAWIDDRNHNFVGFYRGLEQETWPRYARYIADRLAHDAPITDPLIVQYFGSQVPPIKKPLFAKIKAYFKREE